MNIKKKKRIAALLSIVSNVTLTTLKLVAGILSCSLSVVSEAIHSVIDLLASVLTFFSVIKSSKPADADHPYGHGKYEDMAGFIEGILIVIAALFIIFEAVKKIVFNSVSQELDSTPGVTVMLAAVIINYCVSAFLFKVSKDSNSISLYADGEHLRTDVYSSLGVLVGLVIIKITGHALLDPIIAILVAVFIYRTGYSISKKTLMNLVDHSLPEPDIKKIEYIVNNFSQHAKLKSGSIKARQVGPTKDIDLILQFPNTTTICDCHKICDEIEKQIQAVYTNCSISIHFEPSCYSKDCQNLCSNTLAK